MDIYPPANNQKKSSAWAAYLCSKYAQYGKSGCSHRYLISKAKAEDTIVAKIKELASNVEAQEEFIRQNRSNKKDDIKARIKVLNSEIVELQESRTRITNLLTLQDFDSKTIASFEEKLAAFDLNEVGKLKEIEELNNSLSHQLETENMTRETMLSLMDFDKIWKSADFTKKKMLLASIIKKIIVSNEKDIYLEFNRS